MSKTELLQNHQFSDLLYHRVHLPCAQGKVLFTANNKILLTFTTFEKRCHPKEEDNFLVNSQVDPIDLLINFKGNIN